MKKLLEQYAAHNVWAHQKMFDVTSRLTEEQINRHIPCSFSSIYKTVLHLLDAETMWWQRLKLQEHVEKPSTTFVGSFADLETKLMQQSRQWQEWVYNANDLQLSHVFAYQNTRKEQFKQPVNEVLLHLFNHGTYHRGQLVAMFHQLDVKEIPATDFIVYTRTKK